MKQITGRIKLPKKTYEVLRLQVLARDGWQCQVCGRRTNLEVHHKKFRSRQGSDTETNLITLCNACHSATHGS
jgi:5-methylcytosine-specific restriction endonuclease McrA